MTIKVKDVTVPHEGRDKGKVFRLTEMPSDVAEKWGWRAVSVLGRSGVEIPDLNFMGDLLVVAAYGFQALMTANFAEAEPLLDEMMGCVLMVPDPGKPDQTRKPHLAEDIQEIRTRLWLRDQVLELHTGFSVAAIVLTFQQAAVARNSNLAESPISAD